MAEDLTDLALYEELSTVVRAVRDRWASEPGLPLEALSVWTVDALLPLVAKRDAEGERLREALELIGTRCESFTGPLTCVDDDTRSPHGKYMVDRWCDGCIARTALKQPEEGHHV